MAEAKQKVQDEAAEKAGTTKLDSDVTKPSVTAPGDGPADTTDPKETAHSAPPSPGPEAIAVGTVNAVKPGNPVDEGGVNRRSTSKDRIETYEVPGPDGKPVKIRHNIDTGATERV